MVLSLFSGKARADLCVLNSGRSCAEVNRHHVFCVLRVKLRSCSVLHDQRYTHTSLQRGAKEDLSFVWIGSHTPTIDEIAEL